MTERLHLALTRSLAVADALAGGPLPFSGLRTAIGGLAAPTLARLLRALISAGYVIKGAEGYALGQAAMRTARRIVGSLAPAAMITPRLADLSASTRASAAFYQWSAGTLTIQATNEVAESFHYMPIGQVVPELTRHGFAQAVVACLPEEERAACWRRDPRRDEIAPAAFEARLAQIRRTGVAIERGEHLPGVVRVASAVRAGEHGPVIGSLGVSALTDHPAQTEAAAAHVAATARAVSRLLRTQQGSP